jgi:hypothetical protein
MLKTELGSSHMAWFKFETKTRYTMNDMIAPVQEKIAINRSEIDNLNKYMYTLENRLERVESIFY